MKNLKDIVLIVAISILVIGPFVCFAESGNSKSISQLIDTLANDPNEHARVKAALLLGETRDALEDASLMESILTDSSYRVRIASMRAQGGILNQAVIELYKEQDKGIRNATETQSKISELKRRYSTPLKELFNPSYRFNCNYPNEVKAAAVGFFILSDDPDILPLLIKELKKNCALSLDKRKEKENPRMPYRGNALTSNLQHVIATYGKKAVPSIEKEYQAALKGDYKYSLLIILNKISQKLEYSKDAGKYVPVHKFAPNLLPQCKEGLLTTESPGIKRELASILKAHGYTPVSTDAQKIMEEFSAKRDINTKY